LEDVGHGQRKRKQSDQLPGLLAGQLGIGAVLANVLIDKGIVSRDELYVRFRQAYDAAVASAGDVQAARPLVAMISYLDKNPDLPLMGDPLLWIPCIPTSDGISS
jgi:hypothetical protein